MSTNTPEARDLLRLYKCVVDTGTDVLTAFAKYKLLPTYNGNFKQYLDDKKHELFHLWQSQKLLCCACPAAGCNLKRMSHMSNWIFKKIYEDNGTENRGHIVRNSRNIVQVCLHKYVTRNIAIHELDISTISFLLRNLAILSQNETTSLDIITTTRSQICHAYSMNCYPMALLNTAWTELENALIDLVDPSFKRIIRKEIKQLRKADLEKEEITELMKNAEEVNIVLVELKSSCNNNFKHFKGMESRLTNMSFNNTEDIKQHTTEQTRVLATQAQQALSEKIQNTEEKLENCIKFEVEEVMESQESRFQQIGNQLHETRTDIKEVKENQEKTQVEILRAIQNLTLSVKYERPVNLLVPEETCEDAMECPVLWQIETPEHWNLEAVEATLRNPSNNDEQFKEKFVRKGSLIMLTTIAASILIDPEAFEAAVISFLTKMIDDCNINTDTPCRLDVTLHILNANEGITKHRNESEKFDVAFLNGDHEKEIRWVHTMSTLLKEQYGITCAIPAVDYLHGFPLKRRLNRYLKNFKVVILTVTQKNYTEYYDYIESEMPIIVVELDYISHIRWTLWDYPYINCTTCAHLWFPRLMDTLKSKLPDHIRERIGNVDCKLEVECERCDSIATIPVYHLVDFRKGLSEKKLLLCGSLADEAWLLLLLNQMTKLGDPNWIFKWNKQIDNKFTKVTRSICP
ncbi:uncharacterized protein LOC127723680 isoform X2 [Mytilus californianus]|uniref:uncharacterized protein LOC127723680 isoform X2 n=1 Tax=Mytilus californianus TaxID=6549 RepID=UPI0022465072|nr:uncharacterized protein LOC127723680 isoform X2 [Mytilus californianus]